MPSRTKERFEQRIWQWRLARSMANVRKAWVAFQSARTSKKGRLLRSLGKFDAVLASSGPHYVGMKEFPNSILKTLEEVLHAYGNVELDVIKAALVSLSRLARKLSWERLMGLQGILQVMRILHCEQETECRVRAIQLAALSLKPYQYSIDQLLNECERMGFDFVQFLVSLIDPSNKAMLSDAIIIAASLITTWSSPPLHRIRPVIIAAIQLIENDCKGEIFLDNNEATLGVARILSHLCSTISGNPIEIAQYLEEVGFTRIICSRRQPPFRVTSRLLPMYLLVSLTGTCREFVSRLLAAGLLDSISFGLSEADNGIMVEYLRGLRALRGMACPATNDAIMNHKTLLPNAYACCRRQENHTWRYVDGSQIFVQLLDDGDMDRLTIMMTSHPVFQYTLSSYLRMGNTRFYRRIAPNLLRLIRNVPFTALLTEMREMPIKEVQERLLDPTGRTVRNILNEPAFEDCALKLVWLALALGLQDPWDERGRIDMFAGNYPDEVSRACIMSLRSTICILGATSQVSFRSTCQRAWLTNDLWRLVFQAIPRVVI